MAIISEIWATSSYMIILILFLVPAIIITGALNLLDLIDKIKKKIKESEK